MKQVSTTTEVLLLTSFAINVAFYLCVANDLCVLSCIFLGTLTLFSYLAVLSHMPKGQSRLKLFLLTLCCAASMILFFYGIYLGCVEKCGSTQHKNATS
jgi:hypothetical protein